MSDPTSISARCHCGITHHVPVHLAGSEVECTRCGRVGVVPAEDGELLPPARREAQRAGRWPLVVATLGALILCAAVAFGVHLALDRSRDATPAAAAQSAPPPPTPMPAAAAAPRDLPETVEVVSDGAQVKAGGQVVAMVEKGRRFGVLARRGDGVGSRSASALRSSAAPSRSPL